MMPHEGEPSKLIVVTGEILNVAMCVPLELDHKPFFIIWHTRQRLTEAPVDRPFKTRRQIKAEIALAAEKPLPT